MCTRLNTPRNAVPLTCEEVAELEAEGVTPALIEGLHYDSDDCYACADCGSLRASRFDLDDDMLCENCAEDACEYRAYRDDVRWTWSHSRL